MSEEKRQKQAENKQPEKPAAAVPKPAHPCPLCYSGNGGSGREYSRRSLTRYLRCTSCGHTWTETPKGDAVEVTYREVVTKIR